MILVMDAGNTSISFAVMDGERILHTWAMNTNDYITIDMFQQGFAKAEVKPRDIEGGMLASVTPWATPVLMEAFQGRIKAFYFNSFIAYFTRAECPFGNFL